MGLPSDSKSQILVEHPREYFADSVEAALRRLKFEPSPLSRNYLIDLLERFMFSHNLFAVDVETGKMKKETLAELYLRAHNSPPPVRQDLLKKLGDSSLYISGFFGDSLNRKIVDIDYYVDMGGVAYGTLASDAQDEALSQVYGEYSARFAAFVDVLTYISQSSAIQTNEDLLRLYDRYMATGSRLAEEQLVEKGLINADLQKTKNNKM